MPRGRGSSLKQHRVELTMQLVRDEVAGCWLNVDIPRELLEKSGVVVAQFQLAHVQHEAGTSAASNQAL